MVKSFSFFLTPCVLPDAIERFRCDYHTPNIFNNINYKKNFCIPSLFKLVLQLFVDARSATRECLFRGVTAAVAHSLTMMVAIVVVMRVLWFLQDSLIFEMVKETNMSCRGNISSDSLIWHSLAKCNA